MFWRDWRISLVSWPEIRPESALKPSGTVISVLSSFFAEMGSVKSCKIYIFGKGIVCYNLSFG